MPPKKTGEPRKKLKPRTKPAICLTEDRKIQILSKINDVRDVIFGETTPTNNARRKRDAWSDILEFCNSIGAKYEDEGHFR